MKICQKFLSGYISGKCCCNHPAVFFNNLPINRKSTQKHIGLLLDEKINFSEHINEKLKTVTKSIDLLRKLNLTPLS